jgi:hypothetical protein
MMGGSASHKAMAAKDVVAAALWENPHRRKNTILAPDLSAEVIHVSILGVMTGAERTSLDVPETIHIAELKGYIMDALGVKRRNQRLLKGSTVLSDEQTLLSIGSPSELLMIELQWKCEEDTFKEGDLVQLHYDGNHVCENMLAKGLKWIPGINDMLGRTFDVRKVSPECVWLPAPEDGKDRWIAFPNEVMRKAQTPKVGDIVKMNESRAVVKHSFTSCGYAWHHLMEGMLGKEFRVLALHGIRDDTCIIALPSPDGSQGGKWYFPMSVVTPVTAEDEDVVRKVD